MIYTIGHSTHKIENFILLLQKHGVDALADVRSVPYSRRNPQYNREALNEKLREQGIAYVFLGNELGGRTNAQECYENGQVSYRLLAKTPLFRSGIERLCDGNSRNRIALMCAEKDPLHCHRTILVARQLVNIGVDVGHILDNGQLETHDMTMKRLLKQLKLPEQDMFYYAGDAEAQAYAAQEKLIAYTDEGLASKTEMAASEMSLFTIGFTKKSAERFFEMLRDANVKRVVDVRLNNVSQLAGFAKKNDLTYFLQRICGIDYIHLPLLAPTKEMLDSYKKKRGSWEDYEHRFTDLMAERRIENNINPEMLEDACLLCSEDKPHHCHRRLVAEYLKKRWGTVEIQHLV